MYSPLTDMNGLQNKHVMVQYWFDGPPVEVKVKPHGNARTNLPFFRTAESAKKRHREIAASNKPKEAVQVATQECGGELEAKGVRLLPRNVQQMKNYRRSGHTVAVKIKFTFRNRTTIVQRSLYGTKTVQKTVLIYYYVSVYAHRFYGTQAE